MVAAGRGVMLLLLLLLLLLLGRKRGEIGVCSLHQATKGLSSLKSYRQTPGFRVKALICALPALWWGKQPLKWSSGTKCPVMIPLREGHYPPVSPCG